MKFGRISVLLFVAAQLLGLLCMFTWQSAKSSTIWGTALITLFPGNFISSTITDRFLWDTHLSGASLRACEISVLIAINGGVWLAGIRIIGWFFRREFRKQPIDSRNDITP